MNPSRILLGIAALTSVLFLHSLGTNARAWQDITSDASPQITFDSFNNFIRAFSGPDLELWVFKLNNDGKTYTISHKSSPPAPAPAPEVTCPCCCTPLGDGYSYLCPPPVCAQPIAAISSVGWVAASRPVNTMIMPSASYQNCPQPGMPMASLPAVLSSAPMEVPQKASQPTSPAADQNPAAPGGTVGSEGGPKEKKDVTLIVKPPK